MTAREVLEEAVASIAIARVLAGHTEAGLGHNLVAAQAIGIHRWEGIRQAQAIGSRCFAVAFEAAVARDMVSLKLVVVAGWKREQHRQRLGALREAFD